MRIASEMGRKEFVLVSLVAGEDGAIAFPDRPRAPARSRASRRPTASSRSTRWPRALDAGTQARVTLIGDAARAPDLVIMGSHDIALDVVVGALAERGFSARTIAVGSQGGVAAARRGECDLAPVHLVDPATGVYNKHLLSPGLSLVKGWQRMQGVLFRPGDARFEGKSAHDAVKTALADPSCLMVNRNAGAGTRILIDSCSAGARPPGYANQPSRTTRSPRRSRRRAPTGASRSSRWRGCTGSASCRSRRSTTISCWSRAGASARRCRRFSRRCATPDARADPGARHATGR